MSSMAVTPSATRSGRRAAAAAYVPSSVKVPRCTSWMTCSRSGLATGACCHAWRLSTTIAGASTPPGEEARVRVVYLVVVEDETVPRAVPGAGDGHLVVAVCQRLHGHVALGGAAAAVVQADGAAAVLG